MNRQLATIATIAFALTGLSACNVTDINRVIPAHYSDTTVVADVRPVVLATTEPCEGAFQRDAAGQIIVEGAADRPLHCPTPKAPAPAPAECEGDFALDADGNLLQEGAQRAPVHCP